MKKKASLLYRSSLNNLLQDNSETVEQLCRSFGLLFFSLVAKFVQENYHSCIVEFYSEGYIKLFLEKGRVLEAFKRGGIKYFQFLGKKTEGAYCIQYSGSVHWLRQTNEVFPAEPAGVIYFNHLAEAKEFFDHLHLNAILLKQGNPVEQLDLKVKIDGRMKGG